MDGGCRLQHGSWLRHICWRWRQRCCAIRTAQLLLQGRPERRRRRQLQTCHTDMVMQRAPPPGIDSLYCLIGIGWF